MTAHNGLRRVYVSRLIGFGIGSVIIAVFGYSCSSADATGTRTERSTLHTVTIEGLDCQTAKTMQGVDVSCDFAAFTAPGNWTDGTTHARVDTNGIGVSALRSGNDLCVVAETAQGVGMTCDHRHFAS